MTVIMKTILDNQRYTRLRFGWGGIKTVLVSEAAAMIRSREIGVRRIRFNGESGEF